MSLAVLMSWLFLPAALALKVTRQDSCTEYFIPTYATMSGRGKLWEYYHFLVDFAPPMYYFLHKEPAGCKILKLPGWFRDSKFKLTYSRDTSRTMQPHFDYLLGKPLNLTLEYYDSLETYGNIQEENPNAKFINWTCHKGYEGFWAGFPSEVYTTFRDYARSMPGVNPEKQDVLAVKRVALPPTSPSQRPSGAARRKLPEDFYTDLMADMTPHQVKPKVVALEQATLTNQIDLFAGAKVIIAQHGAALSNIMFASPGSTVVEIGDRYIDVYETLAKKLGLKYIHYQSDKYPKDLSDLVLNSH